MKFPPSIRLYLVPCVSYLKTKGVVQPGGETIHLGASTNYDMVRVLIHEVLRVQHPKWTEKQLSDTADKKYNSMGWRSKATYLRGAFSKIEIGWPPREDTDDE